MAARRANPLGADLRPRAAATAAFAARPALADRQPTARGWQRWCGAIARSFGVPWSRDVSERGHGYAKASRAHRGMRRSARSRSHAAARSSSDFARSASHRRVRRSRRSRVAAVSVSSSSLRVLRRLDDRDFVVVNHARRAAGYRDPASGRPRVGASSGNFAVHVSVGSSPRRNRTVTPRRSSRRSALSQ